MHVPSDSYLDPFRSWNAPLTAKWGDKLLRWISRSLCGKSYPLPIRRKDGHI